MSTSDAVLMDHEHGAVNNRCSHPACAAAFARWNKGWKHDKHRGVPRTLDCDLARGHIAALEGAGWSRRAIAAAAGISASAISRMCHDQKTVKRDVLTRLLAVDPTQYPSVTHRGCVDVFVPRVGTVRRIQALLAIGWTHAHISARAGVTTHILLAQQGRWVTRSTHDKVAAAYRELSGRAGPSPRTRGRAASLGYLSPASWDDIDTDQAPDYDNGPAEDRAARDAYDEVVVRRVLDGEFTLATNRAERVEIVARWRELGRPVKTLEKKCGWQPYRYYTPERKEEAS